LLRTPSQAGVVDPNEPVVSEGVKPYRRDLHRRPTLPTSFEHGIGLKLSTNQAPAGRVTAAKPGKKASKAILSLPLKADYAD